MNELKEGALKNPAPEGDGAENHLKKVLAYGQSVIQHTINKILCEDYFHVLAFCFYLRKNDSSNYYTTVFLKGTLKPDILFEIVLANEWNETFKSMEVDKSKAFKMTVGSEPDFNKARTI